MKTNDRNEKLNPTNLQELTLEEMENVTGGGIREIVAATTLAAMAMTGNTAGAFGLARAMAENAGSAHIEEAPRQEAFGTEYDGVTVDDIEDVASEPVEVFSEALEAPVEEVVVELGGEAAALPMEESAVELADAAAEALSENPVFEIGSRKVFKLNALAAACGITGTVENVGTTNDDDTLKFVVFTDEAGDLAIEFPHSFDALELAFFTEDGIQTVTLVNAVIPEAENFVEEEAPVEEATPVEDAILVEEVPAEEAPLAEAAAPTEEAAPVEEEAAAEEVLAEEASAEEETPVEEAVTEEAPAEEETAEEAPVEEEAVAEEASEPVMILTEDGAVEVAEKAMDAEEAEEAQEETEADPEAEAIAAAEARRELMAGMIDSSVEARRTEGIYAALDNTFATLAENAQALANPETGVIDVEGGDIIVMTYDALNARFDNTPEQLMGAIGAAAMRADSAGFIQILGGDQALVNLASINIDADQVEKDILKSGKIGYDSFLDGAALANPAFKPYVPLFKAIGGELFGALGGSADPNAVILSRLSEMDKKLDAIEAQITQTEQELKDHSYNVVSLAFLGDENNTVQKLNGTVRTYIGDIMNPENTSKTDAEKLQALADMYDDPLFKSLVSAVEGATLCFTSTHNDIFQKQNVFEAAYDRACEEVMFSGEAVDLTIPYLTGQLKIFEEACVTLNAVYDAREAVYGAGSVSESREKMSLRLCGLDRNGNKVQNSVFECFSEYLGKDRFIFVNRSNNTNIKLNTNLLVYENFGALATVTALSEKRNDWTLPYFVGQTPLSTDQVESLADYCKQRNITIWDFLVHDMGFGIQKIRPTDTNFREVGDLEEARVRNPSEAERQAQQITGIKYTPNIYITGAQKTGKLEKDIKNTLLSKYEKYWVKMNVINACVKGAGNENKLLRYFNTNTNTSNPTNKIYDIHLLMFQSR